MLFEPLLCTFPPSFVFISWHSLNSFQGLFHLMTFCVALRRYVAMLIGVCVESWYQPDASVCLSSCTRMQSYSPFFCTLRVRVRLCILSHSWVCLSLCLSHICYSLFGTRHNLCAISVYALSNGHCSKPIWVSSWCRRFRHLLRNCLLIFHSIAVLRCFPISLDIYRPLFVKEDTLITFHRLANLNRILIHRHIFINCMLLAMLSTKYGLETTNKYG